MKIFTALLVVLSFASICFADQWVNGYTRKDGTYVNGYNRSERDSSYNNNYSTRGNVNPYTGQAGSNPRTYNDRTPDYNIKTYGNPGYESPYGNSGIGNYGSRRRGY